MKRFLTAILAIILLFSCSNNISRLKKYTECGVSKELAIFRKTNISDVSYNLLFAIPQNREEAVTGSVKIEFSLEQPIPVILDFKACAEQIAHVTTNGTCSDYTFKNEHIIIPGHKTLQGTNSIEIKFIASDQSLNRRDDFLYTLLVPDRARTLFPCIDQPDIKALYTLSLEIPEKWQAIANGAIAEEEYVYRLSSQDNKDTIRQRVVKFDRTEPLSTYLFSFVAGIFQKEEFARECRKINIYHRENGPKRVAQCKDIANEVFDALQWLEKYTGIPYPFAKYDLIILPGFQYGGMEHTGATLYNDNRMFLNEHPTINERLNRSLLIAHETAHMWFGDLVTMKWFDDVWTKEVFANYFASRIVEPQFKETNHRLNFILEYLPSSYSEDRTDGANPIKQQLDNLNYAGLVYGNIIYNKSPVVMEMLVQKTGEENFRKGIQEYLKTYAYGNATWEELVRILNKYTAEDLEKWSHFWVNTPGMPEIEAEDGEIPNADGRNYGYFKLSEKNQEHLWNILLGTSDSSEAKMTPDQREVMRGSLLITLYENLRRGALPPQSFMTNILRYLEIEQNPLLLSLALGYAKDCHNLYQDTLLHPAELEHTLWKITTSHSQKDFRLQSFRAYAEIASTEESMERLTNIWKEQKAPEGVSLSESDYINLSYTLALNIPDMANNFVSQQLARISNPDRKLQYRFIAPSVSPEKRVRDSVFHSLLEPENRRIEPWASTSLAYLNHRLRQKESLEYIRPALEEMTEIQQTGDIFFPRSWAKALLSGHYSKEAAEAVGEFFAAHPHYPLMLGRKIKQQAWHLTSQQMFDNKIQQR